jgi:hypothetical protein
MIATISIILNILLLFLLLGEIDNYKVFLDLVGKKDLFQMIKEDENLNYWTLSLVSFIFLLILWSFFVDDIKYRITILGIVAAIITAITSVITINLNNKKTKEREYNILLLKEKHKFIEKFYNAYMLTLKIVKKEKESQGKRRDIKKMQDQVMENIYDFKKGLMNWGSEELIKSFFRYEAGMDKEKEVTQILKNGNLFFKSLRKEIGFKSSDKVNIACIMLDAQAREELGGHDVA